MTTFRESHPANWMTGQHAHQLSNLHRSPMGGTTKLWLTGWESNPQVTEVVRLTAECNAILRTCQQHRKSKTATGFLCVSGGLAALYYCGLIIREKSGPPSYHYRAAVVPRLVHG